MSLASLMVSQPPLWVGAVACYPNSPLLRAKFTVVSAFGDEQRLYREMDDKILLPRAVCPPPQDETSDLRVHGAPVKFDKCTFKPRNDDQARVVEEMVSFLKDGQSFIFQADTGFGKTTCSMPVIAAIGRMTAIVVHKSDLIKRWRDDLINVLGLKPSEIGLIQGDTIDVAGRKVILCMVQSIRKRDRYPAWVKQNVGFVLFDEVHHLGAVEFCKAIEMFPAALRMGVSATPKRKDELDTVFQAHIGPVRVRGKKAAMKARVLRIATAWKCPRNGAGEKIPHGAGRDMHVKVILSKNPVRNAKLARAIKASYDKGRTVVFFSHLVDHAKLMQELVIGEGVPIGDVRCYLGESTEAERKAALQARIVPTTYMMMKEGTDYPALDTCVLGTPVSDIEQIIGRILREHPNKRPPTVIDPVDSDSPVFKGYAHSRMRWYKSKGYEVVEVDV